MLRIDRVSADFDVQPSTGAPAVEPTAAAVAAALADPQARQQVKEMVLEALHDHFRELERRGDV